MTDEDCTDGVDNDLNGATDCWDEACYDTAECAQLTYRVTTTSSEALGTLVVTIPYGGTTLSIPGSSTETDQSRFEVLDTQGIFAAVDEDTEVGAEFIRAAHIWGFGPGTAGPWFTVTFDHTGGAPPSLSCDVTDVADTDSVTLSTDSVECEIVGE